MNVFWQFFRSALRELQEELTRVLARFPAPVHLTSASVSVLRRLSSTLMTLSTGV